MQDRVKKPPLRAQEVTDRGEEDSQKGSLDYANGSQREGRVRGAKPRKGYDIGQIFLPVVIALVLTFLIVFQYSASKSSLRTLDGNVNTVHDMASTQQESIDENTRVTDNLNNAIGLYAKKDTLGDFITMNDLGGYVKWEDLPDTGEFLTAGDLPDLSGYATLGDLPDTSGFLTVGDLADYVTWDELPASGSGTSLVYSISGTYPDFTLTVTSPEAGDFAARITLGYPDTVAVVGGNYSAVVTEFYSNLASPNRRYEPVLVYDNSQWWLSSITTRTVPFTLEAGVEKSFAIALGGLGTYIEYDMALVEVLPGIVNGGGGSI